MLEWGACYREPIARGCMSMEYRHVLDECGAYQLIDRSCAHGVYDV
jgi:hypothetical protein